MSSRLFWHVFVTAIAAAMLPATAAAAPHNLYFDSNPLASKITTGSKTYIGPTATVTDKIFRDGLGREVSFKGWNVSGSTKLVENGFKPFKTTADAQEAFDTMGERAGSNMVRFAIAWEGVNPTPDTIDYAYLDSVTEQIKAAIKNRIYVLLDYHQDLYSRHLFNTGSWYTGNGAPKYAVSSARLGKEYCGWICPFWGQHMQTDSAMRSTMNDFWYNNLVNNRRVQDAFMWQAGAALAYIKSKLTTSEWNFILGVDSWNEPFDGGTGSLKAGQFENTYIWGFQKRFRAAMDTAGWAEKPVFAELLVWWNSKVGLFAPSTGGFNLTEKPGSRYVFSAHFYDGPRIGGTNTAAVNNGSYFSNLDEVRAVARAWQSPAFVTEFGMAKDGTGSKDPDRVRNATHQALEISDSMHAKNRYADAYTALLPGAEWQWDYYWNRHAEKKNFSSTVQTTGDAWNGEDFSTTGYVNNVFQYNVKANNVQRIYPRRAQGDIMSFYFANQGDSAGGVMKWAALRPPGFGTDYLRNNQFALLAWQGRTSEAPTEVFVPNSFAPANTVVVTDKTIRTLTGVDTGPVGSQNEVLLLPDIARRTQSAAGRRLLVWDDADAGESPSTWHYALVFKKNSGETFSAATLQLMQTRLNNTIQTKKLSPVWLTGSMTNGGYPADNPL